jgi:8-oxo-dGTP pyrophosphatase MutT (NUDIX family)
VVSWLLYVIQANKFVFSEFQGIKMNYVRELRSLVGHRPLIIAGAAVLIIDEQNRLLLQHRKDNHRWGLIGGSMEIGESLEETARREVFEETNLEIDELEWFGIFSGKELIYQYPNGDVIVNVVAVYTAQKFRGKTKADRDEGYEVRFFDLKKLPKDLSPPDKVVIDQYLQQINDCSD